MAEYILSAEQRAIKQEQDRQRYKANRVKILEDGRKLFQIKQKAPHVSQDRLKQLLDYSPETGVFTYKVRRGKFDAGHIAGTVCDDLRVDIVVDGRLYRAHRLAWLYVTGKWPEFEIDHRDTNPSNNSWANLRDVTSTVNKQNKRRAQSGKKYSELLGAQWCKQSQKWKSSIRVDGKIRHIGFFASEQEAHEGYVKVKRELHEGCTI